LDKVFRGVRRLWPVLLVLLAVVILAVVVSRYAASGRDGPFSAEAKEAEALVIVADYAQDHDLERAEARLARLRVANVTQWLVMLAERHISDNAEDTVSRPLAQLAEELGGNSQKIALYLRPPTPTPTETVTPVPIPTASPTATTIPPTAIPEPPTATPVPPTATPEPPTPTPTPNPGIIVKAGGVNLRTGPSTVYPLLGSLEEGQQFDIVARNQTGDWWQICCLAGDEGWVFGELVEATGPTADVAVAASIPEPPPTPTPAPPTATPEPTRPPIDFVVNSIRLWGVEENGGRFDGPSLHCGEKRQLRVIVQDVNGAPLNGVGVFGIYSKVTQFTGDKGPGITQFVLGGGDDVKVVRDVDGREVTSEVAVGLTTDPRVISDEHFIAAGYCNDAAGCEALRADLACFAHYSWDVVFRRTY
jgi:hypothetical protein